MTIPTTTTVKTDWVVGDLCRINGNVYRIEEVYSTYWINDLPNYRVSGHAWVEDMESLDK